MSQRTEVESGAWWLEMEDPQNEAKLGSGRPMVDSSHCMGPTVDEQGTDRN